jgi:hypothetical protein
MVEERRELGRAKERGQAPREAQAHRQGGQVPLQQGPGVGQTTTNYTNSTTAA